MTSAEALTPAWLTGALAPLLGGSRVLDVAFAPVGTGQMSDVSLCENVPTSGLPIRQIPRKKMHCILQSSP